MTEEWQRETVIVGLGSESGKTGRASSGVFGLSAGRQVAGYRIEALIGTGGTGAVYRALDERLGRQVALKVLMGDVPGSEDPRLRFIREAKAAAAVDHPNIIPIYEAGESPDGLLFIAMRFVRGGDVWSLLSREGQLTPERTMSVIAPVAAALDDAHAAGLVHRDVKPGNMLLDPRHGAEFHVYLTDFGITAFTGDAVGGSGIDQVIGTPNYMAPEQVEGRSVDRRADQYGLACSAFEMLSGAPPFGGGSIPALFRAIRNESPPLLSSSRPELPTAVDAVFARGLAKAPGDRYGTCGQFAEALGGALGLTRATAASWMADSAEARTADSPVGGGPDVAPDATASGTRVLDIPLKHSFRYVHEPSRASDEAFTSLGNDDLMADLEKRVRHSRGGTFLITGFRGVGKSTLVMRALDEIASRTGPAEVVVPVALSVARSTTTERLLFAIVRRVFETLSDLVVLERLSPQTRHALLVSYMRTSLSYKETQSKGSQQSAEVDLGLGPGKLVKAVADLAAPKVAISASRSQALATEAGFLAYSETDVEYDLMRIISLVNRTLDAPSGRRSRLRRLRSRREGAPPRLRLRLVIVLDEVDKLTVDDQGLAAVEDLLSGTKNVLTTSGAHFLVIAGPDLHDRAIRDANRGSGVYESVFGWRLYVPCIWDAPRKLLADLVMEGNPSPDVLETLEHYLRFKARGVPRRLLQEVNSFVVWTDEDRPHLRIDAANMDRVAFYARMERIMRGFMEGSNRTRLFPVAIDEDRWRLGGYYVVDWVLQSEGDPFTAADLLREGEEARFDPLLRISRRGIDRLLDHLASHQVLQVVRDDNAGKTVISDVVGSSDKVYRLSDEIRRLLYGFAAQHEEERPLREVALDRAVQPSVVLPSSISAYTSWPAPPSKVIGGRYALGELADQGVLGSLYKGRDLITGQLVMVKLLLLQELVEDPRAMARFRREAQITRKLNHEQVVRVYDVVDGPDEYAIVQERLSGPTLEDRVREEGPISPSEVAGIGEVLADALVYLSAEQVIRLDLKPGNIVMADRGPVIQDLAIAFQEDHNSTRLTMPGALIGTPAYMAPEVIQGVPLDARADIYGLGLMMFFCLGGKTPWHDLDIPTAVLRSVLSERIDVSSLAVSDQFRAVIERAVAQDRNDRFPNASTFSEALRQTPEWQALRGNSSGRFNVTMRSP